MNRTEIAPGVFVNQIAGQKFKRCKISIHLVVPGSRENATELALLPHLLDRSCAAIPDPLRLSRRLFDLYGAEIASESYTAGANRVLTIGISGLKNAYALQGEDLESEYLTLACQLLFAPKLQNGVFNAAEVEIEKEKQADYLRSEMNDKRMYCLHQARRSLFKNSPMGIESSGYLEDIEAITAQSLFATYHALLATAQIEAFVVGANAEKAAQILQNAMVAIKRSPAQQAKPVAIQPPANFEYFEKPMDTVQGKLCIMCTSGSVATPRQMAIMRVATAIFGGLPTSRLFVNVREKQSLCYYCAASYAGQSGVLTIDSGVDHASRERAAKAVLHELTQMQTQLVSEQELQNATDALTNAFTGVTDNPDALENWAFNERLRGTDLSIEDFLALLQNVTREEIRTAMASFTPAVQYAITGKEEAK
ncbi:insulinase family protein [Ruminococcaceae bacterium OttesenSCG-928-A16]|nr:insulinase family protein [Ruminococcaceae bacterium OttesenSCG-928-A16]